MYACIYIYIYQHIDLADLPGRLTWQVACSSNANIRLRYACCGAGGGIGGSNSNMYNTAVVNAFAVHAAAVNDAAANAAAVNAASARAFALTAVPAAAAVHASAAAVHAAAVNAALPCQPHC